MPQGLVERLNWVEHLPPSPATATTGQEGMSEQWTEMESSVREVLETLVSQDSESIHRDTTIYRLGLDSISAVQIASMLRKRGHQVVASDVIENPTCASLARFIETRTPSSGAASAYDIAKFQLHVGTQLLAHGIAPKAVEAVLPCTPVQSSMMAQFIKSGGRDYFNQANFELEDGLEAAKVVDAWYVVLRAHPILRTTIVPVDHDDCAFAMVQYYADTFEHGTNIITQSSAATFNLQAWEIDASQAAFGPPRPRLWSVAVVQGKMKTSMHLVMHHALYDAHSLQSILDDLSRVVMGRELLPRTPIADAVADIIGHALSNSESSAEFWKQQAEKVVMNTFPILTPLRETSREILTESTMSNTVLTTLETAASKSAYPVQVILQAAWTRVLSAYLGESSVVFGVVLFGRNAEATRNAVFPCITTLPVISRNSDSNQTLLTQMLRYNTNLYKEQHQPLTRIQQWLGCPDSKPFDSLLVYQRLDRDTSAERHWRIVNENANIDYPVSIEVEPTAGGQLQLQITFFSDVLAKEQAMLLLKQFDATVQHLAFFPLGQEADLFNLHTGLFSVLPPETAEIPTEVKFLHQFVELRALQAPDTTALHFVTGYNGDVPIEETWTYAELNDNGNRVAQLLLPRVNHGDIVAIYFDKCPEAYFSILGILKAGCAFLALDPGAPHARNEFILQDSGASVLVTSRARTDNLELSVILPTIFLDQGCLSAAPSDPLVLKLKPNDVCYCLYTSGTTGTPKGCEITHDNAVQCMLAFRHIFAGHWQDDSRWLQFASLHFDVSVLEQYWSWSVGITLVAAPRDLILEDLAGAISRLGITHIDLTPSLARLLHPDDVPSLCKGVFITGGESLKQEILDVWGSKSVIYNFYGPTEATIGVTVFPRVPITGRASNIGKQFVNVGSYVLKPGTQQPVLRGGVGELCVSGRLVGKGYLKRENLTAEKFPILQQFGDRVYRTGDLVRVLHDGCFDFLGRADDQVKLRGQRLEIGEINHAIRKGVDSIQDVATLVVRNESQKKDLLVSFITTADGARREKSTIMLEVLDDFSAAELCQRARDACRSKLPSYMVPAYVLQVSFIPLSSNNKAETKRLATFFTSLTTDKLMSLSSFPNASRRALSGTGTRIVAILAAMQKIEPSSVKSESSIFELGIDSITVLRLSRELKKEGFSMASPSLILCHPLIGDLVGALESNKPIHDSDSVAAARQLVQACGHKHRAHACRELGVLPGEIEYIAPCSPLQQGMISRVSRDSAYFNTFQLILHPGVSAEEMRSALQRTFDAYPVLRTKFVSTPDGIVQVALNDISLPWSEMQLEAGRSTEDAIREMRNAWIARNTERLAEPFEVVLVNTGESHLLLIHIFHALYDANSFDLILNQLASQYVTGGDECFQGDDDARGPSFIEALCHGPLQDFRNSREFWMKHLEGTNVVQLPKRLTSPPTISVKRRVDFADLDAMRTNIRVTHQALVQTAWVSVLAKHRAANPTIGIIVSGRNIALDNAEAVVGPLFNTLPFHAPITAKDDSTWTSLIQQCHEFNTAVLGFQHVPLRDVQKWCSGGQPLFDTLFSFQRNTEPGIKQKTLWTAVDSEPNADYPLALEAMLNCDGHLCLLIVAQDEEATRVETLMDDLEEALKNMARNPSDLVRYSASSSPPEIVQDAEDTAPNRDTTAKDMSDGQLCQSPIEGAPFEWTKDALIIRNEIADLADIDPQSVPVNASLLSLGLDSIDVIRLSALLRRKGVNIKTSDLMKAQTIIAITRILQTKAHDASMNDTEHAPATQRMNEAKTALRDYVSKAGALLDGEVVLPATPLQESMVMEMIESDFQLYFNHDILELAPSVDVTRMAHAWRAVIAGSPLLRTTFMRVESPELAASYCQVIGDSSSVRIAEVGLNETEELAKICHTATLRAQKGTGRSDLLQLVFATDGEQRFLVLSIAHALYDGWSLALIHKAVQEAYEGTYRAQTMESYTHQLESVLFQEHRDAPTFWAGFLQGVTPTLIPENQLGSANNPLAHRDEVTWPISAAEATEFCKANAITLQTLGQACWAAFLAAKTATLDVTFGVVLSCRDTVSLEGLMFPTMNTVPIRSVLHGTVSSWVRYMQENMNSIGPYRHFPLRAAQKAARSNGPLFNTLFIQQRGLPVANQVGDRQLMESVGGTSRVEYPVCVEMEVAESSLVWRIACDGAYASPNTTVQILRELNQLLVYITRSPEASVLSFSGQRVSVCGQTAILLPTTDCVPNTVTDELEAEDDDGLWSPLEETFRDVLAAVSGTPAATILKGNNIYHLGLDSISAIKAGSLLRKKGVTIRFRDLLKAGSISEMAMLAHEAQPIPTPPESADGEYELTNTFAIPLGVELPGIIGAVGLHESNIEEVLPATSMQVHMLSVWQNTHGKVFYPYFQYTLSGKIEVTAIATAWEGLVAETPILRTVFVSTTLQSTPILQVTLRPTAFDQTPPSVNDTAWDSRVTEHSPQPYNSLHVKKDGDSWDLRLKIHHALYDAISLPAIMERFVTLCSAKDIEESIPSSFRWRNLLAPHLSDGARVARQQFWAQYLAGTEPRPSHFHRTEGDDTSRVGVIKQAALQGVSGIANLCKERGVSLQALLFAAYAESLASTTVLNGAQRPETVVFGIYLANRGETDPGADTYPFLRLVPLRVVLQDSPSLFELAGAIQRDIHAISSLSHVEVGLWEIKDWTGVTIDSFVNFLAASPSVLGRRGESQLELRATSAAADPISHDELDGDFEELAGELANNPARDAFPVRGFGVMLSRGYLGDVIINRSLGCR
jgi:amino acid adenylation domain-containing protein